MKKSRLSLAIALICVQVFTNVISVGVFRTAAVNALAESVSATIDVSNGNSRGVAVSADGAFAYVTSEVDNALIKVDLATNAVVQVIDVGTEPYGVTITPDGNYALVANFSSQSISKIRLSDYAVTSISLAGHPQNVAVDPAGNYAYVTLFYENKVSKIDLSTNSVVSTIAVGAGPRGIAVTPNGLFAFTANDGSNTSSKINLTTFTVKKTIPVGTNPYGATVDATGTYAYISNLNGGGISKIDISSELKVGAIDVTTPWALAIVPGTPFAYASVSNGNSIVKINLDNDSVLHSVTVGLNPRGLAVNVAGTSVFVTNYGIGRLQKIDILSESQTVTFGSLSDVLLSSGSRTVSASASSGLTVSFSSDTSSVCTVSGTTVTLVDYGVCTVKANQAGGSGWAPALEVSRSFTVARQVITFESLPDVLLSSGSRTVSASASSGLTVSFSSDTSSVCTVSGTTVTLVDYGVCTVKANQAGANNDAALEVSRSFTVARQVITFESLPDVLLSSGSRTVSASASSGLTVSFSSDTSSVCTVSGTTVTLVDYGVCTVKANQAGANNDAALEVSRSFTVARQVITFESLPDVLLSSGSRTVSASASSGLTVSFSSDTSSVCTVSGTTVTLVDYGVCTVKANQAGANNDAALEVSRSFTVARQVITFESLPDVLLSSGSRTVSASASSGLTVSFSSDTSSVCTVSGTTVTLLTSGVCTLEASQAGANGDVAAPVTQSFYIAPNPPLGEFGISINDGKSYSNVKTVSIYIVWPAGATKARISNDGAFSPSRTQTFDLDSSLPWELDDSIVGLYTKIVYVRFSGFGIDTTRTYSDDIIFDNTAPVINSGTGTEASNSVTLVLNANDDISGVSTVEISTGSTTITENYSSTITLTTDELNQGVSSSSVRKSSSRELRVRVKDGAGNWSNWRVISVLANSSTVVAAPTIPTLGISKTKSISSIAKSVKLVVPKGSKLSIKVSVKSAKICKVSGSSVKGLKPGSCVATLSVKPVKGKTVMKTVTIKIQK